MAADLQSVQTFYALMKRYTISDNPTAEELVKLWHDPAIHPTSDSLPYIDMFGKLDTVITENPLYSFPYDYFEDEDKYRFYLRALTLTKPKIITKSQLRRYSNKGYSITYDTNLFEKITLTAYMFNTFTTPWADMFQDMLKQSLEQRVKTPSDDNRFIIGVPQIYNTGSDEYECEILNVTINDTIQKYVAIAMELLLIEENIKTRIIDESA